MKDLSQAASELLLHWNLRDRTELAAEPRRAVDRFDLPTQRTLYLGVRAFLEDVTTEPPPRTLGRLRATTRAVLGEEHRWQTALLLVDELVLQIGEDEPTLGLWNATSLSAACEGRHDEPLKPRVLPAFHRGSPSDQPSDLDPDLDGLLNEILEVLEADESGLGRQTPEDIDAWMRRVLPNELARLLRFVAHLSATRGCDLHICRPDQHALGATWRSLRDVYLYHGNWGETAQVTAGPRPRGVQTVKEAIASWGVDTSMHDFSEVVGAYQVEPDSERGFTPLVPSSDGAGVMAHEIFARFRTLRPTIPLFSAGPHGEVQRMTDEITPDWRPALVDRLLMGGLPAVATATPGSFERVRSTPALASLRHLLRDHARTLAGTSAGQRVEAMAELEGLLRDRTERAAEHVEDSMARDRKALVRDLAVGGLNGLVGYLAAGPSVAAATGLAGAAISAALGRGLSPAAALDPSDLALLMLVDSSSAARKRISK